MSQAGLPRKRKPLLFSFGASPAELLSSSPPCKYVLSQQDKRKLAQATYKSHFALYHLKEVNK